MEDKDRNDELVHANVERFQAALEAGLARVEGTEHLKSLVAVLDGSDQDGSTLALVRELAIPRKLAVVLTCGHLEAGPEAEDRIVLDAQQSLAADGLDATVLLSSSAENHLRLRAVRTAHPDACFLLPSPFGHDYVDLAQKSLGTAVEVALAESTAPTLVVRGPIGAIAAEPLSRSHVVLRESHRASARAVSVALGLLEEHEVIAGTLSMSFVHDGPASPLVDEVRAIGFGANVETLLPLLPHGLSALLRQVASMSEQHGGLRLDLRLVLPGEEAIDEDFERGRLHILPRKPGSPHVDAAIQDFVLGSSDPVLVVPARA